MRKLLPAFVLVFLCGVIVGGVGGLGSGLLAADEAPRDFDSPPLSLSKSSGSCADPKPHSGWVHDVAVGRSFAVTLNATVTHGPNETVTANVSSVAPGYFRIDLRTVPSDRSDAEKQKASDATAESECVGTQLRLGTNLPSDYAQYEVAVDGRTLKVVEYDGTVADLHQLPNPIDGRDSAN